MKSLFICCSVLLFSRLATSANIAVFMAVPLYSHQITFKPLWIELARRGHRITLIQPHVMIENNANITHVDLDETMKIAEKHGLLDTLTEEESMILFMLKAKATFEEQVNYVMTRPEVLRLLKGEDKVDLVFTETMATYPIALASKLGIPTIGIFSMDASIVSHWNFGNPTHPVAYPDKDSVSSNSPFLDRMQGFIFWLASKLIDYFMTTMQEKSILDQWGMTVDLKQLEKNMSMMFINANPIFNAVRPLGPKTVNIGGGLHILGPKPLPKEFQEYLDKATDGVIYFSLGSTFATKYLPNATREVILKTFSQIPYKVLWKLDEKLEELPSNVKLVTWVPQQDVLRHKNVKLFITQGGLQSMEEAIFNHVPMVSLPFIGDQFANSQKMVNKGFGLSLDPKKLDQKTFENAILEVINNRKYKEKAKEQGDLTLDQPMTGLQKAVWWTEYVLRHPNTEHFKDRIVDLPWYQFLFLDVISTLLLVLGTVVYILVKTLQILKQLLFKLYSLIRRDETKNRKKID